MLNCISQFKTDGRIYQFAVFLPVIPSERLISAIFANMPFQKNERKTLLFRLQIPFFTIPRGILSLFFLHFMPIFSEKGRYVLPKIRRLFIHCPYILPTNLVSFASRSHNERLQYPFPLFSSLFLLRNSVLFRLTKSAFKQDIANDLSQKIQELLKSPIS